MTTQKKKLTSVAMAAMLLLSVLAGVTAFAGTAAAASNTTNASITPTNVDESTSVQHTIHAEVDNVSDDATADTFYVKLPDAYANGRITIDSVSAYNTSNNSETYKVNSKSVVDRDGDGTKESIKFTISPDTSASAVDVSFDVTTTLTHPSVSGSADYPVNLDVIDSGNADILSASLGTITVDSDETVATEGGTHWVGQALEYGSGISANEVVELKKKTSDGSTLVRQIEADSDGVVTFRTDKLSAGEYFIEDDTNTKLVNFTLASQSLNVTADDTSLVNDDTKASSTHFNFDSNRANYDVVVSAEGLEKNQTVKVFKGATLKDVQGDSAKEVVLTGLGSASEVDASVSHLDAGKYNFNFDVTDTPASSSVEVVVEDQNPANAEFSSSTYQQEEGDVVPIKVNLENTNTANVTIGTQDVAYVLDVTVQDGNDDGTVTLLWNTHQAGNGDPIKTANSDDSVTVNSEDTPVNTGELEPATYQLDVFVGPNNKQTDVGLVNLVDRKTGDARTGIAPSATDDNIDAVKNATTFRQNVAMGDKVVLEFNATGLYGYLSDSTSLAKGANSHGVYVTIEQSEAGMNAQKKTLDVTKGNTYILENKDQIVVVLDTSDYSNINTGESYDATLHVTEDNPYVKDSTSDLDEETATNKFTVVEQKVNFYKTPAASQLVNDDGTVEVFPAEGQQIAGSTTLAPGTKISVTAESTKDSPFIKRQEVTVGPKGNFAANYDFSGVTTGTKFTVRVPEFGVSQNAKVVAAPSATVNATEQTVTKGERATLTLDKVTVSEGGFVAIRTAEGGQIIGFSDYLSAGTHENVKVEVPALQKGTTVEAIAYMDADGDQKPSEGDTRYSESALSSFTVNVEEPTKTTEKPTETETTSTPAPTTTETTEKKTTTETTTKTPGSPGFGVAVSLIALLGAALVAVRRE